MNVRVERQEVATNEPDHNIFFPKILSNYNITKDNFNSSIQNNFQNHALYSYFAQSQGSWISKASEAKTANITSAKIFKIKIFTNLSINK